MHFIYLLFIFVFEIYSYVYVLIMVSWFWIFDNACTLIIWYHDSNNIQNRQRKANFSWSIYTKVVSEPGDGEKGGTIRKDHGACCWVCMGPEILRKLTETIDKHSFQVEESLFEQLSCLKNMVHLFACHTCSMKCQRKSSF